jgi:hypothetical protein
MFVDLVIDCSLLALLDDKDEYDVNANIYKEKNE